MGNGGRNASRTNLISIPTAVQELFVVINKVFVSIMIP